MYSSFPFFRWFYFKRCHYHSFSFLLELEECTEVGSKLTCVSGTGSCSDSQHMLLPSVAQRLDDWNGIHLWISIFDSAFNWVFCTLKCSCTVCFEMDTHAPRQHVHSHKHSHNHWEVNRVSPFPLISTFHYAGVGIGGYFTKHSLSPAFFYEMEIITVGEKPSTRHCQS